MICRKPSEARTIFALSSGAGRAAISVIRVSGPFADRVFTAFGLKRPKPRFALHAGLIDARNGERLDDAVVLWFPAPNSFTGYDTVELNVHGSVAVVDGVLKVLSSLSGFDFAEPGEFARQAFLNGRMSLPQIEGLADLIDAETQNQKRQALSQMGGVLGANVEMWSAAIRRAQTLVEARIDFADEGDVDDDIFVQIDGLLRPVIESVSKAVISVDGGERLRQGFQVAIIGPPNAGKSSLLNALAGRDVAIVTDFAGTTRDILSVSLNLGGLPILVSDTAGLRHSDDVIELEGMRRARLVESNSDLVLFLKDDRSIRFEEPAAKRWNVATKSDRFGADPLADISVSVRTGYGLTALVERIEEKARLSLVGAESAVICRRRHEVEARSCLRALRRIIGPGDVMPIELIAEELRLANMALARLVGMVSPEDVLSEIFARFCIGK